MGIAATDEQQMSLSEGVTVGAFTVVSPTARLGHHVSIGSNTVISEDATIDQGVSVGSGVVVLPGVRVGRSAIVGPGSVVTRDVPPFAIVSGNPATIQGYADVSGKKMATSTRQDFVDPAPMVDISPLKKLRKATDMRGSLVAAELGRDLPFVPQRFFIVYDVPSSDVRGEHAHRECQQFLVCVKGAVRAITDDGTERREYLLDSPHVGLHMPAMVWGTQYAYTPDAVLAVFASLPYDPADYIRTYAEFVEAV